MSATAATTERVPLRAELLKKTYARLEAATLRLCLSATIDRHERHAILQDITVIRGNLRTLQRLEAEEVAA